MIFRRHRFSGTDEDICRDIIDSCFNGVYFQVTPDDGNYPIFYARDFGMCCEALVSLGHKQRVHSTLKYAISAYKRYGRITVAISRKGRPFNFPDTYSPDSVAYFFRSLRIAKAKELIIDNKTFLNSELRRFEENVIDKEKGIVADRTFSGMRDHAVVRRSCYDMIMACMLHDEILRINKMLGRKVLDERLGRYDLKNNLIKYYWDGYFKNSPDDKSVTGHCNIFPYWLDVISDKSMMRKSLKKISEEGLDIPFPLKYEQANSKRKFIWQEIFVLGWERDTHWGFLAMPYIDILSRTDKKKTIRLLSAYKKRIEKDGFIEVYRSDSRPYRSLFFASEDRILWAAMYLDIKRKLKIS